MLPPERSGFRGATCAAHVAYLQARLVERLDHRLAIASRLCVRTFECSGQSLPDIRAEDASTQESELRGMPL